MYGQEQYRETLQGDQSGVSRGNLSVSIDYLIQYLADVSECLYACVGLSNIVYSSLNEMT